MKTDVIIIGGGIAGLTAGIHLAGKGISVILFEKNEYPRHKVCGEYISNETLPYLNGLGIDPMTLGPARITHAQFSTASGKHLETALPLGGFGLSRHALDQYLMKQAERVGVNIIIDVVDAVSFEDDQFKVATGQNGIYFSEIALGAFGKRSALDIKLKRKFIRERSSWLAVKAHYSGYFPDELVALHHFNGGYCGISKVEDNKVNVCYLTNYDSFKRCKNIHHFETAVLCGNRYLKKSLDSLNMLFDKPLSISQVSFKSKGKVLQHVLMLGDAAGLIHPLCGNGMAMAIHSAKLASEELLSYFSRTIRSRNVLEHNYIRKWEQLFKKRLWVGNALSYLLKNKKSTEILFGILTRSPMLLREVIKQTHGKYILSND